MSTYLPAELRQQLVEVDDGSGVFVIVAESYETFADAILKKLIGEMAANEPRPHAG